MDYKEKNKIAALVTTIENVQFTDEQLAEIKKTDMVLMQDIKEYLAKESESKSISTTDKVDLF